ncbi:reprolysin-like metallopeptidase [Marinibactrum halimedae]|uniref:Peptidase M12B domain-containing protein n=1 Tax=Marinibactrum halimedae TaxID=1444977 RepID=A0AA37T2L8_9GAMM|nr:zinc-dependent metalloprotease family protein [Marinibactrum halimedae]MCD9458110.1 M12 family metallo-peptidase [Marinibactrum halimedae]GLS25044.1 hypothetical protein GCM10007877_07580 [Marinibactrum halimedae]
MFKRKVSAIALSALLPTAALTAAEYNSSALWSNHTPTNIKTATTFGGNEIKGLSKFRTLSTEPNDLISLLNQAPNRNQKGEGVVIDLPLPNNNFVRFRVFEDSILEPELQKKFPQLKTYWGYDESNPKNRGRFDITEHGFHGMFTYNGETVLIDPGNQKNQYLNYLKKDAKKIESFTDEVLREKVHLDIQTPEIGIQAVDDPDGLLRTYRLAVATTGEFTQFFGGSVSDGLSAVVTTINRVNEVYEVDLAVRLNLVADNDELIYTNPNTDPYSNGNGDLNSNTRNINSVIGSGSYDIGHIFQTSGGGVAGLGVVCGNSKGRGLTGLNNPVGDPFYIDYVAHEIGHQFRGEHTFNGTSRSCGGANRSSGSAYEPGSGATIMAYAGICDDENLQNNSDPYFHTHSITQISNFIENGGGRNCASISNTGNNPPVANAGNNFTIPANTPFTLTGSATDSDAGDTALLTYVWEQYDLGSSSSSPATMVDNGNRPIFRSFNPTSNPSRTFPNWDDLIDDTSTLGVSLPTTNRDLDFRLTVRDTNGGVSIDDMTVSVVNTGSAFTVTTPSSGQGLTAGAVNTITWNVAGTTGNGINCSAINVDYSTNNGDSFSRIASGVNNIGSAAVAIPSGDTTSGRLQLSCANNLFFALSDRFSADSDTTPPPPPPPPTDECINLENVTAFSNRNDGTFTANDCTIELNGNIWRATTETFTVSASSRLEFDFSSNEIGEIHGIGLTQGSGASSNRVFKLAGSQNYGIDDFTYNGGTQSFSIPVGQYFTGSGFRLILVSDDDAGGAGSQSEVMISNVRLVD